MNSKGGTEEVEKERIKNKGIHEKSREKRKKDWKENQREKVNSRNRGMHQ